MGQQATRGPIANAGHRFGEAMFSIFGDSTEIGSTSLWDKEHLDWTVEALVHDTPITLEPFGPAELQRCKKRLAGYAHLDVRKKLLVCILYNLAS